MNQDLEDIKKQIKENVQFLINSKKLDESSLLIDEYFKMVYVERYSIKAVIAIMKGKLDEAEKILKDGLIVDGKNYELNYNLGYVYEIKKNYFEAIIAYKKALIQNYYNIDFTILVSKINELKQKIFSDYKNQFQLNVNQIENILFIDFNVNKDTHFLAKTLNKYGINVDLAYNGLNPMSQLNVYSNPYRKILGIIDISGLIQYAKYYNYNNVYTFNTPDKVKNYFKMKNLKILDSNILKKTEEEIMEYFSKNRFEVYTKYKYVENNNISIIIPTYNRPYYLNRVLTFMNNYKYIKPKIIVLDSSEEQKKLKNQSIIDEFENINIIYNEYPSKINFFEKLNKGLEDINTDYIALCADDDFLTEEGIIESIKKLDEEKNLYSVKGKNLYFNYSMANLIEYDWFQGLSQNDPVERLKEITKGFVPSLIYQVFRTDTFKKMYSFIGDNVEKLPANSTFREYLFYFMVIITGKIGKINVDLNIRDKSVAREIEIKNFPHAVKEGNFNDEYKKLCEFLGKYIELVGHDKEKFYKNIPEIFSNFLINFLKVPKENVIFNNDEFDIKQLEIGMRKSWVWPPNL